MNNRHKTGTKVTVNVELCQLGCIHLVEFGTRDVPETGGRRGVDEGED